jgi:hypothetical protein
MTHQLKLIEKLVHMLRWHVAHSDECLGDHQELLEAARLENLTKLNGHHNGPTLIELMKHADEALASIKEPSMTPKTEREQLERELAQAKKHLAEIQNACMKDPLFKQFTLQEFWHAHHVNIVWRFNGKDKHFEADWLKDIWYIFRRIADQLPKDGLCPHCGKALHWREHPD